MGAVGEEVGEVNLIEGIQAECNRLREMLPAYKELGPIGAFGHAVLSIAITEGEAAIASGDVVRMARSLAELKECE